MFLLERVESQTHKAIYVLYIQRRQVRRSQNIVFWISEFPTAVPAIGPDCYVKPL